MKKLLFILFMLPILSSAQTNFNSLLGVWNDKTQPDSVRVGAYIEYIFEGFLNTKPDSAAVLAEALHSYAQKHNYPKAADEGYSLQGYANYVQGNYLRSIECYKKSLAIREKLGDKRGISTNLSYIGLNYSYLGNYPRALEYHKKALAIREKIGDKSGIAGSLSSIGFIYSYIGNYPRTLENFEKSLAILEELGDKQGISSSLNNIGMIYTNQGNYPRALEIYKKSLTIFEELENKEGISSSLGNIGNIYLKQSNYPRALENFEKSLAIFEELGYKQGISSCLNNIGTIYADQGNNPRAFEYYKKALAINEEIGDKQGIARSLNNIGIFYYEQVNYTLALEYYEKALAIEVELGDKQGISISLHNIGDIYQVQGNFKLSLDYCQKSLALAEDIGALEQQKYALQCLYNSYKAIGNTTKALKYYEQMIVIRDSIYNEENTKKLVQIDMQYKFDRKEAAAKAEQDKKDAIALQELKRQKIVRNGFMGGFTIVFLFAGVFFIQRNRIGKEKKRSEELLLNILPAEVAKELKDKGEAEAKLIEDATVLFTDFKGFTGMSEILTAKELVADLNHCFTAFDEITHKHRIEKIKTIGDSYMAAGGLPTPNKTHAKDVVLAALEICDFIEKGKSEKITNNQPFFEIRIGIHTGPLVAGIVGVKKFQYDIWGDTVNTASRMESSGESGKVNISQSTYQLLKEDPDFGFEHRGKISAKGKGEVEMYFISLAVKNRKE